MGGSSSKSKVAPGAAEAIPFIAVCGPPGSNKGKICSLLSLPKDQGGLGLMHLTVGQAQRLAAQKDKKFLGQSVKEALDTKLKADIEARKKGTSSPGAGVSDELNAEILHWIYSTEAKASGWVLDSYPASQNQVELLQKKGIPLRKLVLIDVTDEELIKNASGRKLDLVTSKIYHLEGKDGFEKPPQDQAVLDRLYSRQDDREEKVRARLREYHEEFDDVYSFFDEHKRVDGNKDAAAIVADLKTWLTAEDHHDKRDEKKDSKPEAKKQDDPDKGKDEDKDKDKDKEGAAEAKPEGNEEEKPAEPRAEAKLDGAEEEDEVVAFPAGGEGND